MKPKRSVTVQSISTSIYRLLLFSYPPHFRGLFQEEMAQTFRDCCCEAIQQGAIWGLTRLWGNVLADLIFTAFIERVHALISLTRQLLGMSTDTETLLLSTGKEQSIMAQFNLTVGQQTDIGLKRKLNEDNMISVVPGDEEERATKGALFVVADGMGGHTQGEVASELAINTIREAYYHNDGKDRAAALREAVQKANERVYRQGTTQGADRTNSMGTTCVAVVLQDDFVYVANVGDSRTYLMRNDQIRQITEDHSWVAQQIREGKMTPEEARVHPKNNVIYRCLGTAEDVEIDIFSEQVQEGDLLVLCTDGLSGLVNDQELQDIVGQHSPEESVQQLVARANEHGGPDNITAIVVRVSLETSHETAAV
jgi:serine/threonine protein phosphatase PrpC